MIEPRERGSGGKSGRWGWTVCVWVGERGERDASGNYFSWDFFLPIYLAYVISEIVYMLQCEYRSRLYFCLPQQNGKEINPQDLAAKKKSALRGSYQLKVTENGTGQ